MGRSSISGLLLIVCYRVCFRFSLISTMRVIEVRYMLNTTVLVLLGKNVVVMRM